MAEELRFFLRVALYSLVAGTIYWFVSYEWAGTFLFGFVVVGAGFFAAAVAFLLRGTRAEPVPRGGGGRGLLGAVDRTLGFEERPGEGEPPLTLEEERIPPASAWPLVVSLAALLVGLGLIYGAWFWLPGLALGVAAAYGWMTELTR